MLKFRIRTSTGSGMVFLFLFTAASAAVAAAQATGSKSANDEWLTATKKLYYSSAKAGLAGFDCALHPDWRTLVLSANNGTLDAAGESKVTLLNQVTVFIHAHMEGNAKLDWNQPPDPGTPEMAQMLESLHGGANQTIDGFVQFWAPFIDASVIPDNSNGVEMGSTPDGGMRLHSADKGTEVTELFDKDRVLKEYDVIMKETEVDFTPQYSSTDLGLIVSHFHAFIRPKASGAPTQELNVGVTYGSVDGFPIPARLDMTVVGTGVFNFTLDGCTVTRK